MRVLFSVHSEFAQKIIAGEKRYELRKRLPVRICNDGFAIYVTQPVGKVVAQGRVGEMLSLPPNELWNRIGPYCGLCRREYDAYFKDVHRACAIELLDVAALDPAVPLSVYAPRLKRPPQSYAYIL